MGGQAQRPMSTAKASPRHLPKERPEARAGEEEGSSRIYSQPF